MTERRKIAAHSQGLFRPAGRAMRVRYVLCFYVAEAAGARTPDVTAASIETT